MRAAPAALVLALLLAPGLAAGEPSAPAIEPRLQPAPTPSADSEYDRGVRARVAKDWPAAEASFRRAIALRAVTRGASVSPSPRTTRRSGCARTSPKPSNTSARPT